MKSKNGEKLLQVVSVILVVLMFVTLTLMVMGYIKPGLFFVIALVVGLFAFKGIKYIKKKF